MKAIVQTKYGAPEVLQLQEIAKPAPKPDEILIRIYAATVTSADCSFRTGEPFVARLFSGLFKPNSPILGTELAGEVEAVGKDVKRFKVGDQIFGALGTALGAYAEYICMPEDAAFVSKPASISFEEAAAVSDGGLTALPFLRDHGKIQAGQQVLINGASGSVGTFALQLARYYGAEVTAVCSAANAELVRSLGAHHVIDYHQDDFTQMGTQYDIIFDAVGKSSFSRCKRALKENGRYLSTVPTLGLMFQILWSSMFGQKKAIFAATGLRKPPAKIKDLDLLKSLVESGDLRPYIDKQYPLEEIAEAHRYVDTERKRGNVVITLEHIHNT